MRKLTDYPSYKQWLKGLFPGYSQVRKISLNAGFTCPNIDGTKGKSGCTFCNNASFNLPLQKNQVQIRDQIQAGKVAVKRKYPNAKFLAYYQAYSNTYAPVEKLEKLYQPALEDKEILAINIGTRADCLDQNVVEWIKEIALFKKVILEVGLQSANEITLEKINRGHSVADWHGALNRLQGIENLHLTTHVILGFPWEREPELLATALALHQHNLSAVKIHPLHIVKQTKMAQQFLRGDFKLHTLEEYTQSLTFFLQHIPHQIAIERFAGGANNEWHIAPDWSYDRNQILKSLTL